MEGHTPFNFWSRHQSKQTSSWGLCTQSFMRPQRRKRLKRESFKNTNDHKNWVWSWMDELIHLRCVFSLQPKYDFFQKKLLRQKPRLSGSMLVVLWVGLTVYLNLPAEGDSQRRREWSRKQTASLHVLLKTSAGKIWPPLQLKEYRNLQLSHVVIP